MSLTIRRPVGTLALLLLLSPSISGCMTTRRTLFNGGTVGLHHITGVTMRSGREIPFREPGASVENDSMYALGAQGQIVLPSDSVALVWNRKTATGRTIGLVAGLGLVGVAIAGAISFSENFKPFGGSSH